MVFFFLDYLAPRSGFGTGWLGAILSATLNAPIKDIVILVALTNEEITEEFAQVGIVRLIIETKSTSIERPWGFPSLPFPRTKARLGVCGQPFVVAVWRVGKDL